MNSWGFTDAVWLAIFTNAVVALAFYLSYAAGQLNVSQPGFMAIGAYTAALATARSDMPAWVVVMAGIAVITGAALLLSLATARLGGVYLAMATLAFVLVVQQLIVINPRLGGAVGIHGIPTLLRPWSSLLIVGVVALLVFRIMHSRLGYAMRIMREDQVAARSLGVNVRVIRVQTMLLSAWVAGVAGAMEALHTSFIGPHDFGFSTLILILSFAIVGGTDRWWGPIVGAVLLTILPEVTRLFQSWREVVSGTLILGVMLIFPEGVVGLVLRLRQSLRRRALQRSADPVDQGSAEPVRRSLPSTPAPANGGNVVSDGERS